MLAKGSTNWVAVNRRSTPQYARIAFYNMKKILCISWRSYTTVPINCLCWNLTSMRLATASGTPSAGSSKPLLHLRSNKSNSGSWTGRASENQLSPRRETKESDPTNQVSKLWAFRTCRNRARPRCCRTSWRTPYSVPGRPNRVARKLPCAESINKKTGWIVLEKILERYTRAGVFDCPFYSIGSVTHTLTHTWCNVSNAQPMIYFSPQHVTPTVQTCGRKWPIYRTTRGQWQIYSTV